MRVLFLSKEGDGLGVGHKLTQQGHIVDFWIKEPRFAKAGRGIVNRPTSWREVIAQADLIICDMVGFGYMEDLIKRLGKPVVSCCKVLEQAELERDKGMRVFRSQGIAIPPTYEAATREQARDVVRTIGWGNGWVIKPSGNISTAKTMVLKEPEEWEWAIGCVPSAPMILQQVVDGVEVSTEGWWNGRDWIRPFNHTFEEKCFLTGNLGPATGCMGNVVFTASSNRLTRETVERLTPFMQAISYRGPVDINCIVDRDQAYALEITARMGYDAVEGLLEGLREPMIDLFFECATGAKKAMEVTRDTLIAIRLSVPPWPSAKPSEEHEGHPVLGLNEASLKHIAITDLYLDPRDQLYKTAAGDGVLLKVTARGAPMREKGDFVSEAQNRAYRTLENIKTHAKQYRIDIGDRANKQIRQLQEWGWI